MSGIGKETVLYFFNVYNVNLFYFCRDRIEIDKKKLLEIARKNAINMIKHGSLPLSQQDKVIAAIHAGGKTIDELTGNYYKIFLM